MMRCIPDILQQNHHECLFPFVVVQTNKDVLQTHHIICLCSVQFCSVLIVLSPDWSLSLVAVGTDRSDVWPMIRIYRGGFLLIEFLFLLGMDTQTHTVAHVPGLESLTRVRGRKLNNSVVLQASTLTAGGKQASIMCSYLN